MPFNRRWQRKGLLTTVVKKGTTVQQAVVPVQAWLVSATRSRQQPTPSQPQASQGPQSGGVTAATPDSQALMVTDGATLCCNCGLGGGRLNVIPPSRAAHAADAKPVINISQLGMCTTLENPNVRAATSARFGALTPVPCTPAPAPMRWQNTSPTVRIDGENALQPESKLSCRWGGTISIVESAY